MYYKTTRNLPAVQGSASLSLHTSMRFLERDLRRCGFVRSMNTGVSFSLTLPA